MERRNKEHIDIASAIARFIEHADNATVHRNEKGDNNENRDERTRTEHGINAQRHEQGNGQRDEKALHGLKDQ